MANDTNYQGKARENEAKITRTQTVRAMERLIVGMGGRNAYIDWLKAMPEDTTLNVSGGISTETINQIAGDETLYNKVVQAFATHMGPVLMVIAEGDDGGE